MVARETNLVIRGLGLGDSRLVNRRGWESNAPRTGREARSPFHITCSMHLFHVAFSKLNHFMKNWIS